MEGLGADTEGNGLTELQVFTRMIIPWFPPLQAVYGVAVQGNAGP
jgi:hypothetical protein